MSGAASFNLKNQLNIPKGKNFLVNDTFVRIDGVDWINIQANCGKIMPIHITTGSGRTQIHRPLCEGYVVKEKWIAFFKPSYENRCMTETELNEARTDHYFLRKNRYLRETLWMEYYHSKNSFGETHASEHLQAYNRALEEKRQKVAEANPNIKFEDLVTQTYPEDPFKAPKRFPEP